MKEMIRILIVVFCVLVPFFPGCSENSTLNEKRNDTAVSPGPSGTYHAPLLHDPVTLDPALVHDEYGVTVVHQLFDGLVRFGPDLMILPALAESWTVREQGRVYTFNLRRDACFHDGSPVTAGDVVFSFSRLIRTGAHSEILPYLLMIEGAEEYRSGERKAVSGLIELNDHSLMITLTEPFIPFLTSLGMYLAKIVPRHAVEQLGIRFGTHPVGSGPFRFVSWSRNDSINLERFERYHAGPALLKGIRYHIYPGGDLEHALSDFEQGKLQELPLSGGIQRELPRNITLIQRPSLRLLFYGMRVDTPPLDDPLFRRAVALAINKEAIVEEVYRDRFDPAGRILPPGMPGNLPPESPLTGDLEEAKKIMEQIRGDQKKSIELEIVSASRSSAAQSELRMVKNALADLGIELKVTFIEDWNVFEEYLSSDRVQMFRYMWAADMPDPDNFFFPLFHTGSTVNYTRYSNPEIDLLLSKARRTPDPIHRTELYHLVEEIISQDTPCIPLFYLSVNRAYAPSVKDMEVSALGPVTSPLHSIRLTENGME
ncbi:MAG: ABC transporter substrate-binding protein [Desulfovibrionales bacterium]